ncbi:hypothetical protein [Franzmannia qiaohouensis]|uniref:Uncharacterized protein n=1 Tax=Franzmannia qiaohouensis TaxID=1329370 RepID=A0ABU1HFM8_9GAMM|nr:hypothetical protein [Halomonas qiaohouensis]MDR5905659.1 hypothetical protein [Halomonas qiaohouensis]
MAKFAALRKAYEHRIARGSQSAFQSDLLTAAFDNLEVRGALRFNNFAYSLREFLRHILHEAAPAEEVKKCPWFKPEKSATGGITRSHRAKYAIQGGLSDQFLKKKLGIVEVDDVLKNLVEAQNVLSKYTHIGPDTFNVSDVEARKLTEDCLDAATSYVEQVFDCRRSVRDSLMEHVDQHLIDRIVSDGIDEIDEIATHGWTDGHWIEEVWVEDIRSTSVLVSVEGTVEVGLQYGSDGDVKRDMGVVTSDSFPFRASILVKMKAPLGEFASVESLNVNTDSFYE